MMRICVAFFSNDQQIWPGTESTIFIHSDVVVTCENNLRTAKASAQLASYVVLSCGAELECAYKAALDSKTKIP